METPLLTLAFMLKSSLKREDDDNNDNDEQ